MPGADKDADGNPKDGYQLTNSGKTADGEEIKKDEEGKVTAGNIGKDGAVFEAEFTQLLKETEWKEIDKEHANAKHAPNLVPRGALLVRKFISNSDDNKATGDYDFAKLGKNIEFTIINVSNEEIQNKDKVNIPTWKGVDGYNSKSDVEDGTIKWSDINRAANSGYAVQKICCDENGVARTGLCDLPYGDYLVIETAVPKGAGEVNNRWIGYYEIREDNHTKHHGKTRVDFPSDEAFDDLFVTPTVLAGNDHNKQPEIWRQNNGFPAKYLGDEYAIRNPSPAMGIALEKFDAETKKAFAQGDSSLAGAKFAIINASVNDLHLDLRTEHYTGAKISTIRNRSDYSPDAVSFEYLYNAYVENCKTAKLDENGIVGIVAGMMTTDKY